MQIIITQNTTISMVDSSLKLLNSKVIRASIINNYGHNMLDAPTNQTFFHNHTNKFSSMTHNRTKVNDFVMQSPIIINRTGNKTN